MPHIPTFSAISLFTVIDLTQVRSCLTCVRRLADWEAVVIRVEMLESFMGGELISGARHGSGFLNLDTH